MNDQENHDEMTGRTPAEDLAEVIAGHRDELLTVCSCGDWRPSSLRLTMAQTKAEYEAHVAAAILAHLEAEGWAKGHEEWSTAYKGHEPWVFESRRLVTDWDPASQREEQETGDE